MPGLSSDEYLPSTAPEKNWWKAEWELRASRLSFLICRRSVTEARVVLEVPLSTTWIPSHDFLKCPSREIYSLACPSAPQVSSISHCISILRAETVVPNPIDYLELRELPLREWPAGLFSGLIPGPWFSDPASSLISTQCSSWDDQGLHHI